MTTGSIRLQNTYDLIGVVNHMGSYTSGHYTAFCLNEESKNWLLYNDDEVMEVRDDVSNVVVNKNAYVLFYKKRKISPDLIVEYDS